MANFTPSDTGLMWAAGLPEKELYDAYANTLETRFPAFGVRTFEEARYDMAQPYHTYDGSKPISQDMINTIVTPESHERYADALSDFADKHGLAGWLSHGGSLAWVTDHGMFTDVPVHAETAGRIGLANRATTVQSVSEMISTMEIDLGEGNRPVIHTLRNISGVGQTVPRLDGDSSDELEDYRETKNESGLIVLENIKNIPGSNSVLSLIGRHNQRSRNGKGNTLYIHEPNRRTLETYMGEHVKVIPVYIDCPTFGQNGEIEPADMKFELFPPREITNPRDDTHEIVELFRDATQKTVGDRYRHGVKIRSWKAQQIKRKREELKRRLTHEPAAATADSY